MYGDVGASLEECGGREGAETVEAREHLVVDYWEACPSFGRGRGGWRREMGATTDY